MNVVRNLLWEAIRGEVELTLDSTDYDATQEEIDNITDAVIMDDHVWTEFNNGVMEIIQDIMRDND